MEIVKTIKATYPTVTYGSVEIFTSVKLSDAELPDEIRALPLDSRAQHLNQWADYLVQQGFASEYQQVSDNMASKYLQGILPPAVEQKLIQEGRLKR